MGHPGEGRGSVDSRRQKTVSHSALSDAVSYARSTCVADKGAPEGPTDILKHSSITPGADPWPFTNGDQSSVHPQGRFKADSAHVLAEAPMAGSGIVEMGELVAELYVAAGAPVPIMTDYQLPPVGTYVVRLSGRGPARKVLVFTDLMAGQFASP